MLNKELMFLIHGDRQREIEETMRIRSLLDGRQPEKPRRSRPDTAFVGSNTLPQRMAARPR